MKKIQRKPKSGRGKSVKGNRTRVKSTFTPCADTVGAMLTAHARRKENSRLGGDWLHVSALLAGDCLRAYLIAAQQEIRATVTPRAADRILWAIGKTVEAHIRNSLIELYGAENCLGRWKCRCGESQYIGVGGGTETCHSCNGPLDEYDELNVRDEESRLSGSIDFIIRTNAKAPWTVVEIKSIKVVPKGGIQSNAPEFNTLEAPSRGHSMQALLYRELMRLNDFKVTDEILVVYGAKDYVVTSPYKPFEVDGTAEENVMAVDNLFNLALPYGEAVRNNTLLPRHRLCGSPTTSKAKSCPCVVACFASRK